MNCHIFSSINSTWHKTLLCTPHWDHIKYSVFFVFTSKKKYLSANKYLTKNVPLYEILNCQKILTFCLLMLFSAPNLWKWEIYIGRSASSKKSCNSSQIAQEGTHWTALVSQYLCLRNLTAHEGWLYRVGDGFSINPTRIPPGGVANYCRFIPHQGSHIICGGNQFWPWPCDFVSTLRRCRWDLSKNFW